MGKLIRDVMTGDPVTLEADRTVAEAAKRMRESDVGDVVITRDGELRGVLTDRDIVVRCIAADADVARTTVDEICSKDVIRLTPQDDSDNAVRLMRKNAIRRIPIVEDSSPNARPVGMVSLGDLALDRNRSSALASISDAPPNR